MLAILFAATTIMATDKAPVKKTKVKQANCTSCSKDKCTKKADCPKPTDCPCK